MGKAFQSTANLFILSGVVLLFHCTTDNESVKESSLTEEETNDLLQLREEEKLARDVYLYTYEKYGLAIFINISNSEQTHMDQVLELLSSYDLEDPAKKDTGAFNSEELQNLYAQLVAKVDISAIEALIVGATIEDLDIKDIKDFIERTEKEDISDVYENLMCGSRNHLRAYYAQIIENDSLYSPAYISQSEFDSIISSDNEQCAQ